MEANEYFIVNDSDCPDENHVAEMREHPGRGRKKGLYYIHPKLRKFPHFHGMKPARPTSLASFGFDVQIGPDRKLIFTLVRESTATYKDGQPRKWQGQKNFTIEHE